MNLFPLARPLPAMVAISLTLAAAPASAAMFSVDLGSAATTFEALASGGPITNFTITIGGVTFDTPDGGTSAPVYDALENDINGAGGPTAPGGFVNSAAAGGCLVMGCVLAFEDTVDGMPPFEWSAFPILPGPGTVFALGEYQITPVAVPLPATLGLLAGALALLGSAAGRRRP